MLASDYVMAFEHVSSHQLCGYLYKNQANQNFKIMERGGVLSCPLHTPAHQRSYQQLMDAEGERGILLRMWLLVGFSCPSDWHLHVESTNCTLVYYNKNLNKSWGGGTRESWKEVVADGYE